MSSADNLGSENNKGKLWDVIVDLYHSNPHVLKYAKEHIVRLLRYAKRGPIGPDTFRNEEEYRDFAVSKFFVYKGLQSFKKVNPEAEEGEIGSDDEDKESPPLVILPLTKLEQTKQDFWLGALVGDVFIAKVLAVGNVVYDMILLSKSDEKRTINIFSIGAYMFKDSVEEPLQVNDLVRVAILGHIRRDDSLKMKVTADPSKAEGLGNQKLGKISVSELSEPLNNSTSIKYPHIFRHEVMDKNPQNTFEMMSLLGLDPYKPYTFLPDVKSCKTNKSLNRNVASAVEESAINKIKTALQYQELGELQLVKKYASEAIAINPDYDVAYALRGSVTIQQAKEDDVETIMEGVTDCLKSLELNPMNLKSRKVLSTILEECAINLSRDEDSSSYALDYVEKAKEFYETNEAELIKEIITGFDGESI